MSETSRVRTERRWPGLVLSFFVPGIGLIRAGLPRRGMAWFLGNYFLAFVVGISLVLQVVPVWIAIGVAALSVVATIWMLCDGFRPGRMNGRRWIVFFALIVVNLVLPSPLLSVAKSFRIPTSGMEPTFLGSKPGSTPDHVVADILSYRFKSPQRGDIVVFSTSGIKGLSQFTGSREDSTFLQRLVGMPGERMRITDGRLYANDRPLGEADGIPAFAYQMPFVNMKPAMKDGEDFVIGPDEYFVLGDNVANSLDSRYWGCVPKSSIIGKVTMIYYPFARAGRDF